VNLNTITEVKRPASTEEIPDWREGCAWLAGGTWLFSTPQIATHTLIDLETLRWPALAVTPSGLDIAATCTIAELERFAGPAAWTAAPLLRLCCHALLMSFKIYNAATVGGNIVMSLPAGAMISLTATLEATYTLWPRHGNPRKVAALDFVEVDDAIRLLEWQSLQQDAVDDAEHRRIGADADRKCEHDDRGEYRCLEQHADGMS